MNPQRVFTPRRPLRYDAAWHATQVCSSRASQACYVGSATYTALDQPLVMQLNGTSSTSAIKRTATYSSPLQQLSALTIGVGAGTGLFNRTYNYDNVDNVTAITDVNAAANSQRFAYDDLNRLKCWVLNAASCTATDATYDQIGNLLTKTGTGTLDYPTSGVGSVRPHTPSSVAGQAYSYDANGNLTGDGTRTLTWTAESLPNTVSYMSGTTSKVETSSYDADGERVKLAVTATPQGGSPATVSTVYLEGLWEEFVGGTTKVYYPFNGQMVALREVASATSNTLRYMHGDHIGSISISTDSAGGSVSSQEFDPWGKVRTGSVISTTLGFTGQRLDGSGLMYYHARMYNPAIGRFISADSVVPGGPGGSMQGVALKPLTVDFHEAGFVDGLNGENKQPFWFQLSDEDKQKAGKPWGPANPQALNRYSYVTNNPLRYTDPGGHFGVTIRENGTITFHLTHEEVGVLWGIATGTAMSTSEKLVRVVEFLKSLGAKWAAKLAPLLLGAVLGIVSDILFWGGLAMLAADYFYGSIGLDITMTRNGTIVGVGAPTTTRQHGIYVEIGVYDIWNKAYAPIFGPLPEGVHVVFPACSSFHINFCDDNPEAELNR